MHCGFIHCGNPSIISDREQPNATPLAGVPLMSHLMQHSSPDHLTIELLKALEAFAEACKPSTNLRREVFRQTILNLKLFSQAAIDVQRHLLQRLSHFARVSAASCLSTSDCAWDGICRYGYLMP